MIIMKVTIITKMPFRKNLKERYRHTKKKLIIQKVLMHIGELFTRKLCVTSIKFWGRLMKRKLWQWNESIGKSCIY